MVHTGTGDSTVGSTVGEDWLRAILSYNNSLDYAKAVYGFAQAYARRAQGFA